MIYFLIMYFECAYCNIQLKTKYNLARHIKVTHFTGIEKNNPQLKITSHNFASLQGKDTILKNIIINCILYLLQCYNYV